MEVDAELRSLGLTDADAAALASLVRQPPVGTLDPSDSAPASRATLALQAALLAARQVSKFAAALRLLLATLERDPDLSSFDEGRYSHVRGLVAWRLDNLPFQAMRALNRSLRVLSSDTDDRERRYRARVHDSLGQVLHQQGMTFDALREFQRSLELRDEGDAFGRAITHGNLGRLYIELGDYAAAARELTQDLAIVNEIARDQLAIRAQLTSHLAECHLQMGVLDEAEKLFTESTTLATQCGDLVGGSFASLGMARLAVMQADAPRALAMAAEVLARIEQATLATDTAAMLRAGAHLVSADAHLHAKRFDKAVAEFQTALEKLSETASASPMEYARAYRGLSAALAAKQQHAESARSLRLALRHLDGTAAEATRLEVERELQAASRDSWLLHAAGRFLGQQQIEDVLGEAGRGGFRGARRRMAVLFSDIRGFTSLSENLKPEEVVSFLNDFLSHMTRCVDGHRGSVDKFIGDAVMAVFPLDDHGSGALAAAVAMQDELERFNRYLAQGKALSMGIGVHGGHVVSGLIGSAQKREVTVIGDVVNTASRLESLTKKLGAGIVVSAEAASASDRTRYLLRPLGLYAPRGRRTGVELFDVMGLRDLGPASRAIDAEIARAQQAHTLFRTRAFDEAARAFEQLARDFQRLPRGHHYELLAAKAAELGVTSPAEGWGGEIVLTD